MCGVLYHGTGCFCWDSLTIVDGNWNNTSLCGTFYCNLNNAASNTNANIGSAQSYQRLVLYETNN